MGPMPKASGNRKFLFVATNYFTKWIEEESLARITEPMVEKFVLRNIKFVVQFSIISHIGANLHKKFRAVCAQYRIRNYYSTPAYPPSNTQAEA